MLKYVVSLSEFVSIIERNRNKYSIEDCWYSVRKYNQFMFKTPHLDMFLGDKAIFKGWELEEDYLIDSFKNIIFVDLETKNVSGYRTMEFLELELRKCQSKLEFNENGIKQINIC